MAIVKQLVFALAIVWTIWQILHVRTQVSNGEIVVPPLVASTLVFALCIVMTTIIGISPLHLLWLFPCSFVFGIILLFFPFGTKLIMGFLAMLPKSVADHPQKRTR
jgi:hypothetical protein